MDIYLKSVAGLLICAVLGLFLQKNGKDFAVMLTLAVCTMAAAVAIYYLTPVFAFFDELKNIGELDPTLLGILLKSVGIGILSEISSLVCTDAGNSSAGKVLQILAAAVILWLSIPLFESLIDLVSEILGGV